LIQQPLIREGYEEVLPFDLNEFKEHMEKVKKVHNRLRSIQDFDMYKYENGNGLSAKEIIELIDAVKIQHDFIHETNSLYRLFLLIKTRTEAFCNREFCGASLDHDCIDLTVDEFEE
jgi:hypothetical protein